MSEKKSLFARLREGLGKSRQHMAVAMDAAVEPGRPIDEDFYEELEETLVLADLGMETVNKIMKELRYRVLNRGLTTTDHVKFNLKLILNDMLKAGSPDLNLSTKPSVILVIGVNGVGKTTTIGKIANQLTNQGKSVTMVAADTFRAAAADQLEIWAQRSGAGIVRQHEGADPAAVVFDGIQAAKARGSEVIIIDTAGRLHNKTNLMNELNKISRIVERELPQASREVLLVLDGTTGQNGLIQAKQFKEIAGLIREQFARHGLPLDMTYTGKAYHAMLQLIREEGWQNRNILFIHTGGTPLFFDGVRG